MKNPTDLELMLLLALPVHMLAPAEAEIYTISQSYPLDLEVFVPYTDLYADS